MQNLTHAKPAKHRCKHLSWSFCEMARWTGLEPATPGVTGRYSNQLSYHRAFHIWHWDKWRGGRGSNPRPPA